MVNTKSSSNTDDHTEHLWIDWETYHQAIESLALLINDSGWKFDQVLCLARGGLRPGDVLSRIFDVPLAVLAISSYVENCGTQRGDLAIGSNIAMVRGELAGRILLVDDLVDSGTTLQQVTHHLMQQYLSVSEIRSAVLWRKQSCALVPDYCLHSLSGDPWIHQPFERYDCIPIGQLNQGKY